MIIGFVGLGIMGKPMARNLIKTGYELIVYDINTESIEAFKESGASVGKSLADSPVALL